MDTNNEECSDCNGGGLVKGSNEYEWETYLEPCEACNGDGYVEVQNKPTADYKAQLDADYKAIGCKAFTVGAAIRVNNKA